MKIKIKNKWIYNKCIFSHFLVHIIWHLIHNKCLVLKALIIIISIFIIKLLFFYQNKEHAFHICRINNINKRHLRSQLHLGHASPVTLDLLKEAAKLKAESLALQSWTEAREHRHVVQSWGHRLTQKGEDATWINGKGSVEWLNSMHMLLLEPRHFPASGFREIDRHKDCRMRYDLELQHLGT